EGRLHDFGILENTADLPDVSSAWSSAGRRLLCMGLFFGILAVHHILRIQAPVCGMPHLLGGSALAC
ncbi:hypothetical protein, partial [Bradyrhizobium ivorense]|uniref:hypothetical protein n=1 Tax=Bradyrhizobium ivorense TaxID=2511166 RepID=UPI001E460CE8